MAHWPGDGLGKEQRREERHDHYPDPDADREGREEDVVADLGVGVLDGNGVGGKHDGAGEVHDGPPVVGGVVSGNAKMT